jgi:hypothetical protein
MERYVNEHDELYRALIAGRTDNEPSPVASQAK